MMHSSSFSTHPDILFYLPSGLLPASWLAIIILMGFFMSINFILGFDFFFKKIYCSQVLFSELKLWSRTTSYRNLPASSTKCRCSWIEMGRLYHTFKNVLLWLVLGAEGIYEWSIAAVARECIGRHKWQFWSNFFFHLRYIRRRQIPKVSFRSFSWVCDDREWSNGMAVYSAASCYYSVGYQWFKTRCLRKPTFGSFISKGNWF